MRSQTARTIALLKGLATGDAIGKQTEGLTRNGIRYWYPHGVRGFEGEPGTVIPRYSNNRKHQWRFGETTDDTERTLAVARAVLNDGVVRHASVGREMLACTKCVHPGVKSLWEFHQAGDPARIAREHDGCGAALRVSPVGILYRLERLADIVDGAYQSSIPTHGGALALAAAAATAAAISAAIDGAGSTDIFSAALRASREAERRYGSSRGTVFTTALEAVHGDLSLVRELTADDVAQRCAPVSPPTIVPLAIAIGTIMESARSAILLAANTGGDSDSVASIAGAILGARYPDSVDETWYRTVESVNDHRLVEAGEALIALRR